MTFVSFYQSGKVNFISLVKITTARDLELGHYQIIYRTTPSNIKENIQQKMRFILLDMINSH